MRGAPELFNALWDHQNLTPNTIAGRQFEGKLEVGEHRDKQKTALCWGGVSRRGVGVCGGCRLLVEVRKEGADFIFK
jgi:hypothetical protein